MHIYEALWPGIWPGMKLLFSRSLGMDDGMDGRPRRLPGRATAVGPRRLDTRARDDTRVPAIGSNACLNAIQSEG